MKKIYVIILSILLLNHLSSATEIVKDGEAYPIEKIREQNQVIIKMVVEEISKSLPQKVDSYTTMTQISDKNLTLIYTFEINTTKSDEKIRKEDQSRMEKSVQKGICQSSKRFLDAGISLAYSYISTLSKKELFTFHINQKKCKELNND